MYLETLALPRAELREADTAFHSFKREVSPAKDDLKAKPAATLLESLVGNPFEGSVVGSVAVLFPKRSIDTRNPFHGFSYSAPSSAGKHLITGLEPGSAYDLIVTSDGCMSLVTIIPGSSLKAGPNGLLEIQTGA